MAVTQKQLDKAVRTLVSGVEAEIDVGSDKLRLRVTKGGAMTWVVRYRVLGKGQRRIKLGAYAPKAPKVGDGPAPGTLAWARAEAAKVVGRIASGQDPSSERKAKRRSYSESATLEDAVAEWLEDAKHELRPKTIEAYGGAAALFLAWANGQRIKRAIELKRGHLSAFRGWLIARPKHAPAKGTGTGRGKRTVTTEKRSPVSVNRELRSVKTILNALRIAGKLPGLDGDAIRDCLKAMRVDIEQPEFLKPKAIEKLLLACQRHDAETFAITREEHAGLRPVGTTPRYQPILPFTLLLLLTGCRRGEALALRWEHVDLDATDHDGNRTGEINLPASITKTHRARTIGLEVSPSLRTLLVAMKLRAGDGARVFEGSTADLVEATRARLKDQYGAPEFDWQMLRSTCGTYCTNAPGIFGAASAYMSARRLGHSVAIAERHYLGLLRSIPREARTIEATMRIETLVRDLVGSETTYGTQVPRLRRSRSSSM
jgi:integrase